MIFGRDKNERSFFQGHEYSPILFTVQGNGLKEVCVLDVPSANKTASVNSALQMFKNIDK